MTRYPGPGGLEAILFPVRLVPVFAEVGRHEFRQFKRRKAIVNDDSGEVLAVVSDRYELLTNRDALDIGIEASRRAIPTKRPDEWRVRAVGGTSTGGSCWFDIEHPDFPTIMIREDDFWELFIRVTNSYNGTRAFRLTIGCVRHACENRQLAREVLAMLSVKKHHNTPDLRATLDQMLKGIDSEMFSRAADVFRNRLRALLDVPVPRRRFRPVVRSALKIQKSERMADPQAQKWAAFQSAIDETGDRYVKELGPNAYALNNTVTDVATHPREHDRGRFIRRDRHTLQGLAGRWLESFSRLLGSRDRLSAYLRNPSWQALVGDSLPATLTGRGRIGR